MPRMLRFCLMVLLGAVLGASGARAEERLALVIGNKAYTREGWMPVIPAEDDARDMAAVLTSLGFEVTLHVNLDRNRLLSEVQAFGKRVKAMKGGGIAVVYFSGHGVGLPGNDNFLIPIDVGVRSAAEIERDALSLSFLLRQLGEAPNRLNLIVLDACRNDPFTSSGGGVSYGKGVEGFHPAGPPEGTILQFAARPGTQARWIEGRGNSLYTAHLKREIAVPGRSLQEALTVTEEAVIAEAKQREFVQTPWFEGRLSLASRVWLTPGEQLPPPLKYVQDCPDCPELVKIPAGSFEMGSTASEREWAMSQGAKPEWVSDEGPEPHRVKIGRGFLLGRTEVTRDQFAAFVQDTRHPMEGGCRVWDGKEWKTDENRSWRDPGFSQTDKDPVVCVSWEDAQAYVRWLSRKTGKAYRLPSEAEWEYAARAGTATWRYWGDDKANSALCGYANGADETAKTQYVNWSRVAGCRDGHVHTAPVASYKPNAFDLHDMLGNALEWVEDCYSDSYAHALNDGTAYTTDNCSARVLRGGSWYDDPRNLRSATRDWVTPGDRDNISGFRVARTF